MFSFFVSPNSSPMRKSYLLLFWLCSFSAFAQNDPVAINDTVQVMNQELYEIYPLLNDYDPDGDTIEIVYVNSGNQGEAWYEDSVVYFITDEWFEGWEEIRYRIDEVGNKNLLSDVAWIHVEVVQNPDVPVSVDDSMNARYLESTPLDVIANDIDINGDSLKIYHISGRYNCDATISSDSTEVIFTSEYSNTGQASFRYYLRERTGEKYFSNYAPVVVSLDHNPELPVAVNDTFTCTGGIPIELNLLTNDINPLGDTIEFQEISTPDHGELEIIDNVVQYTAHNSFAEEDSISYITRYKHKPWLYSDVAQVSIQVNKNPNCPSGEADFGSGMAFTPIAVEVLSNDHDPNGDPIEIKDVKREGSIADISFTNNTVFYTPFEYYTGKYAALYRIQKTNDTSYYSEWIPIDFEVLQNPGYPITIPDYVTAKAGIGISINFMQNDLIPDSIEITNVLAGGSRKGRTILESDSVIRYYPYSKSAGIDSLTYILANYLQPPRFIIYGKTYVDIIGNNSYDSLDVNNINAGFNANGMQFSNIAEIPGLGVIYWEPHFEAPNGSGKNTILNNTLWMGGLDEEGNLHMAGDLYKNYQNAGDFQAGPIANTYDSAFLSNWNTMWKLNRSEVEYHRNNWWKDGYEPIKTIAEWPGNGDQTNGMAEQLAPYFDHDGNLYYDPMQGDYPLIRGDQCIFFITNDNKYHSNTQSQQLKLEIQGMGYAFDAPEDSILSNTIFVHYNLINRSDQTYYDTYFGVYTDIDLGYSWDDRVGSDVMGGAYYVYNGEEIDGQGEAGTYGDYPPAQSVSILAGPFMDPDSEDNPNGGCDFSVNGLNFGNNIPDDERYGMTRFTSMIGGGGYQSDPEGGGEYYQYLQGLWKDGVPVSFGGAGHPLTNAVGPECRFMFPGESDPLNWGTSCTHPNGGYNLNDKYWTEEEAAIAPYDKRGLGVCGPFTFAPGDVQEVDLAYVFANSYHSADSSKNLLMDRLMELRQRVLDGKIIIPNEELDINKNISNKTDIQIYPNPAKSVIYIISKGLESSSVQYDIYSITGIKVISGILAANSQHEINIANLENGFYIISVISDDAMMSGKIVKQ